jgi:hypothetical protein
MHHLPQSGHSGVLDRPLLSHETAYAEFGNELESPSGESEVVSVAAIGVVVVEDRLDGLGGLVEGNEVGDVDPLVGVGGEKFCARATKGRITAAE